MKSYSILKLKNDINYSCLVIICNSRSPYDYLEKIAIDIKNKDYSGKILVDQILHSGNTSKRFLEFYVQESQIIKGDFITIKKDSLYRKKACEFFQKSKDIEGSILTSVQKRMIQKGIAI